MEHGQPGSCALPGSTFARVKRSNNNLSFIQSSPLQHSLVKISEIISPLKETALIGTYTKFYFVTEMKR